MLEIVHSNRTEKLVETLARRIADQRAQGSILDPVTVVVPNRNLETYLNLSLAQRHGVSAGLDFLYLEKLAARVAGDGETLRIVDRPLIKAGLLALFHAPSRLEAAELAPVRDYLLGGVGPEGGELGQTATDLRRVQLAEQLSVLLENHQWTRPQQVAGWLAHPEAPIDAVPGSLSPRLHWQAHLWRSLLGPEGVLEQGELAGPELPLRTLASRILTDRTPLRLEGIGPTLHLFGLSYFGVLFHHLLRRLSIEREVRVYLLDPTEAYWDGFSADRRAESIAELEGEDPLGLAEQPCQALALWGKPGGEHLHLLREVAGDEETTETGLYEPPGTDTLLHRLQDDLRQGLSPDEIQPFEGEEAKAPTSLRALACPSLRREVEAVADRIWSLVGASTLRFHEIAVVVPPAARDDYLPILQQVFEAHHRLPHTTADLSFAARSPLAQAAALLLELPFGRFSRAELLRLMTHPAFDAGAGLPAGAGREIDTSRFPALAEAAGIYFGRDDDDLEGTYLGRDAAHWSQGLTRLALGQSLGGPRSGEADLLYEGEGRRLAPEDLGAADPATTRAFGLLARGLIADFSLIRERRQTLRGWAATLRRLLETYCRVEEDRDEAELLRILRALDTLAGLEVGGEPGATEVSGRTACDLAGRAIAALGDQQGSYLTDGVVVSTFLPMRAIPFRAIFVLGLGEGLFPGAARRDPLDLRAARQAGDLTAAERDRHAFLETLLCAREQLCLSWVARDETTGDSLAPSSILLDLLDLLRPLLGDAPLRLPTRGGDGRLEAGAFFALPPLRRLEDPDTSLPEALGEREAARFGRGELQLDDEARARLLREHHGPQVATGAAAAAAAEGEGPLEFTSRQLMKFLESPVQGAAAARLHLREFDEGLEAEVEAEPLEPSSLQTAIFRREALEAVLRLDPFSPEARPPVPAIELLLARAERERLRGAAPRGLFSGAHLLSDLDTVFAWRALVVEEVGEGLRRIHLGSAREDARVDSPRLPALTLPIEIEGEGDTEVRLHGLTSLLAGDELALVLPVAAKKLETMKLHRALLLGVLDHLLLCASDREELCPPEGRRLLLVAARPARASFDPRTLPTAAEFADGFSLDAIDHDRKIFRASALPANEARALLSRLCRALVDGPHDTLLPLDVIVGLAGKGTTLEPSLEEVQQKIQEQQDKVEGGRSLPRSAYGPLPEPFALDWLGDEEALATIEDRFAPLYALLSEEADA